MRFHIVSLPHTQTTADYSNCAFAQLTRRFSQMMVMNGHQTFLYSGEDNDAPCTEHVPCVTKEEQFEWLGTRGPEDILAERIVHRLYNGAEPWWGAWNQKVISKMASRIQPRDFICIIGGGVLFEPLISAYRHMAIPVEYAVGYSGVSPNTWHCFGSSNWQHVVFGLKPPKDWKGRFYDRVIPHYFDPVEFAHDQERGDYLLYFGKLKADKGIEVASRACEIAGKRLVLAGQGPTRVPYGEVLNRCIGPAERRDLLAHAAGVLIPSLYVEPFGMIACEALLSGAPIITTPWGGLGEINLHGVTGFQCHNLHDFVTAVKKVVEISPEACRERGMRYAMENVRHEYEVWFRDLYDLWEGGWDSLRGDAMPMRKSA